MLRQKTLQPGPIEVTGKVLVIRSGKRRTFLQLGYGSDQIQVVALTESLPKLTVCSYVRVEGQLTALPPDVHSVLPYEITDSKVTVLSLADEDTSSKCPPGSAPEVKLAQRIHYFRDPEFIKVMKLSEALCKAFRLFFEGTSCTEIIPPSFTGMECEGGATLFELAHPARVSGEIPAYLTQSSQFCLRVSAACTG